MQRTDGTPTDERVRRITQLLIDEPWLRRRDLAKKCGLSPSRLHHLFREHTGQRLGAYAKIIQLQRVQELLLTTDRPLKDIGPSVGIPDTGNLVRDFKKHYGVTPAAFRRRHNLT